LFAWTYNNPFPDIYKKPQARETSKINTKLAIADLGS